MKSPSLHKCLTEILALEFPPTQLTKAHVILFSNFLHLNVPSVSCLSSTDSNGFIAHEVANSGGAFVGFGTLHPDSPNKQADLRNLVAVGLRGVKLHPDIQHFAADDVRVMPIYEMCADAGLPVLLHTGDWRFDYSNPKRVAKVLRAFPKLTLIGAHLGGWSVWDEAVRILPDFPNLMVDTSSCSRWLKPERMKAIIRAYGADRVLFGTDYPMWRQQEEIDALLKLDLTDEAYRRIFRENAAELLEPR